jgi:ribosomal protein L19E
MKLIKNASGKTVLKLSKRDWLKIGEKQGWTKKADTDTDEQIKRLRQLKQQIESLKEQLQLLEQEYKELLWDVEYGY